MFKREEVGNGWHPHLPVMAEKPEGYLDCKSPFPQEPRLSTPSRNSYFIAIEMGRGSHIASSGENQWGFSPPVKKVSLLETQRPPS